MRTTTLVSLLCACTSLAALPAFAEELPGDPSTSGPSTQSATVSSPPSEGGVSGGHDVTVPPLAQDHRTCTGLAVLGFQSNYPFQDAGFDASPTHAVMQNMIAVTCGKLTVDWWNSTGLGGGTYGKRGTEDEHDLEFTYTDSVQTPFGKVQVQAYAAYFWLDLGKGLGNTRDDFAQIYFEGARPFEVNRKTTITPFVRVIRNIGVGDNHAVTWVRAGLRGDGPLTDTVTYHVELAHAWEVDPVQRVPFTNVWRGELDLSRSIGLGWTGSIGAKFTEHVGVTPLVKVSHAF